MKNIFNYKWIRKEDSEYMLDSRMKNENIGISR